MSERAERGDNRRAGLDFRHRAWHANRERVLAVLDGDDFGKDRFDRLALCGTRPVVFVSPADENRFKIGCNRCHDRFCLPCAQDRARLMQANLAEQLPPGRVRFMTLTLKHSDKPLREQLDRLYVSFRALRRRKFFQKRLTGGAVFLEVKCSSADGRWHPHLHVMCQGVFLPQKTVSDAWREVTGDSYVVDVREAKSEQAVAKYLCAYVTKGWSGRVFHEPARLRELMLALAGRKLVTCFGTWAKMRLLEPPTTEAWEAVGTLWELVRAGQEGDERAIAILTAINCLDYMPPLVECNEPPDG